jgi:ion channel-forming bestrophin family protein
MIVPDGKMSWFRLLFQIRGSALPKMRGRLLAVFLVACAVTACAEYLGKATDLTAVPFSLISLALGVFLGFRNNTSYDRYWEGRRLWGRLVNDARSFARLTLTIIAHDASTAARASLEQTNTLQRALIYRVIAFTHALRLHLRSELSDTRELVPLLDAEELSALRVQRNVPLYVAQRISVLIAEARKLGVLRHRDVHLLENLVTDLIDVQGGCERIRSTPIPWSYTVLMHTIVAAYCFALPFGLVSTTHLLTPVVVLLIAYAFLGLDEVGDELEQPFGLEDNDLPLSAMSRTIEVNLRQLLGESELPALLEPDKEGILL